VAAERKTFHKERKEAHSKHGERPFCLCWMSSIYVGNFAFLGVTGPHN
jgi:hypothetical protein